MDKQKLYVCSSYENPKIYLNSYGGRNKRY